MSFVRVYGRISHIEEQAKLLNHLGYLTHASALLDLVKDVRNLVSSYEKEDFTHENKNNLLLSIGQVLLQYPILKQQPPEIKTRQLINNALFSIATGIVIGPVIKKMITGTFWYSPEIRPVLKLQSLLNDLNLEIKEMDALSVLQVRPINNNGSFFSPPMQLTLSLTSTKLKDEQHQSYDELRMKSMMSNLDKAAEMSNRMCCELR